MAQPGPAASIISPMIDCASTVWPSLLTVTSASYCAASFTNLAEARACRPRALHTSTDRLASGIARHQVGRHRDVLAPGVLGGGHAGLQRLARANAGELDQHRQVQPGDHLGAGLPH